ncbi:MAG: trans-2-enoyl-CoA reductase family protein [Opitutae bacterium]|nr:trans-2-enoyl-CoA reductase family protein [Opitutae bacterium]
MVVKPRVRSFFCITSHPVGCAENVRQQIEYVKSRGSIEGGPKRVLVIGSSTGYGLSSRIAAAFGCGADTIGVFFERPSGKGRTASPGWYNAAALDQAARDAGLVSKSLNGDAFSNELKEQTIQEIKDTIGQVDQVIYSLASPRRTDPETGETWKASLKPIGESFENKNLDTDKKVVDIVSIDPASEEDILHTTKVMGGEDWERWMNALSGAGVLAEGVQTLAYSYIGPEVTWPIYTNGTIGRAKADLDRAARTITESLSSLGGRALVSVNKAVVTQASSAIPVVPLYISILFKIMKAAGNHEGCIEQMDRLYRDFLSEDDIPTDKDGRIRLDDWEMLPNIQQEVAGHWVRINTDTLSEYADFDGYQADFLRLFGFGIEGVDYEEDVEVEIPMLG